MDSSTSKQTSKPSKITYQDKVRAMLKLAILVKNAKTKKKNYKTMEEFSKALNQMLAIYGITVNQKAQWLNQEPGKDTYQIQYFPKKKYPKNK